MSDTDILHELLDEARARCDVVIVDTPPGLGPSCAVRSRLANTCSSRCNASRSRLQTTPQILRAIQAIVATNRELTLDGHRADDVRAGASRVQSGGRLRSHSPPCRHGPRDLRPAELRPLPTRSRRASPSLLRSRQTRLHRPTSSSPHYSRSAFSDWAGPPRPAHRPGGITSWPQLWRSLCPAPRYATNPDIGILDLPRLAALAIGRGGRHHARYNGVVQPLTAEGFNSRAICCPTCRSSSFRLAPVSSRSTRRTLRSAPWADSVRARRCKRAELAIAPTSAPRRPAAG